MLLARRRTYSALWVATATSVLCADRRWGTPAAIVEARLGSRAIQQKLRRASRGCGGLLLGSGQPGAFPHKFLDQRHLLFLLDISLLNSTSPPAELNQLITHFTQLTLSNS